MSKSRDTVENLRTVLVAGDVTNANFTGADLDIAKGGTGSSTAGAARTALGLDIGSDVLAPNGDGSSLTGLSAVVVGSTLPSNGAAAASLFYQTSDKQLYISDGTTWSLVSNLGPASTGGTVVIPYVLESSGSYSYNLGIDFTDDINTDSELTYAKVSGSLPTGAVLPTSGNSSFTGTIPNVSSDTLFSFQISATDTSGKSNTQNYQWTVKNAVPQATGGTVTLTTFTESDSVSYDVDANFTYPTGSTFSAYSVASGALPAGLSLNTSTGVISGTGGNISSDTTYTFTIRATDTNSNTGDQAYSWTSLYAPPPVATGGTVTTGGGYKTHTFTSSGTFTVTTAGTLEALMVSGGGGGKGDMGAGGGGGGAVYKSNLAVVAQGYSIVVGGGGSGGPGGNADPASDGGNTSGFGITVAGGNGVNNQGRQGGTSGGASSAQGWSTHGAYSGGTANTVHAGSGGGGAGGAGNNGANANSPRADGGVGHQNAINGSNLYWGGGGGGGTHGSGHGGPAGNGGLGGGGAGTCNTTSLSGSGGGSALNTGGAGGSSTGGAGGANTGGGGGGGSHGYSGAAGGSGIVIVRHST